MLELQRLAGNRAVTGLARLAGPRGTGTAPAGGTRPEGASGPAPGHAPTGTTGTTGTTAAHPPTGDATAPDGAGHPLDRLGDGQPLDPAVASRLGSVLGDDVSDVRMHTGPESAAAASALDARAFAFGDHVGFADGEYQPGTPVGDAILAHELAHVQQQRAAGPVPAPTPTAGDRVDRAGAHDEDPALERDADRAAAGAVARLWGLAGGVTNGVLQAGGRLRAARPGLRRCKGRSQAPLGPSPAASTGPDHHAGIGRPTGPQIAAIHDLLNPTSTGGGGATLNWDGQHDATKRALLRTRLLAALQTNLNSVKAQMLAMESAKAAGQVLSTSGREGAGRAAKRYVDARFGALASSAVLTTSQETARAAFQFQAGVNLLDASDPSVRPLDAALRADLVDWIADSDTAAQQAQRDHGFNRRRTGQGEPAFYGTVRNAFIAHGSNQADLDRFNQFGFAYTEPGPRVLSQTALPAGGAFSNVPVNPGEPSPAERHERWNTWQVLVHEYIHTLEHPSFQAARQGNRILFEGSASCSPRRSWPAAAAGSPPPRPTATRRCATRWRAATTRGSTRPSSPATTPATTPTT